MYTVPGMYTSLTVPNKHDITQEHWNSPQALYLLGFSSSGHGLHAASEIYLSAQHAQGDSQGSLLVLA